MKVLWKNEVHFFRSNVANELGTIKRKGYLQSPPWQHFLVDTCKGKSVRLSILRFHLL